MGHENCKDSKANINIHVRDRDTERSNVNVLVDNYVGRKNLNGKIVSKTRNVEHCELNEVKCIYTNADSFINKFDELKLRYMGDYKLPPDSIMFAEVLPKNSRYKLNKGELSLIGYEMFPHSFPPGEGQGIRYK